MIRQLLELGCLGLVGTGCYLAWPPLAYIVCGGVGLLWLWLTRKRGSRYGSTR